jgi:hypothetical protein
MFNKLFLFSLSADDAIFERQQVQCMPLSSAQCLLLGENYVLRAVCVKRYLKGRSQERDDLDHSWPGR